MPGVGQLEFLRRDLLLEHPLLRSSRVLRGLHFYQLEVATLSGPATTPLCERNRCRDLESGFGSHYPHCLSRSFSAPKHFERTATTTSCECNGARQYLRKVAQRDDTDAKAFFGASPHGWPIQKNPTDGITNIQCVTLAQDHTMF
ncbi:hypothetical protein HBH98_127970 [Parastagonospora nodorum]|nr:hypothetical protein HBH53_035250 [Parastagonospora nodorum]KAH4036913.1 hypothetical protein HBI09_078980 [Parastagonospora nodorum]KAH4051679.1 hypothetical protein HBH49_106660 [Parastagonospora nodorum]KAH4126655.1 hypothetical protein HBH47_045000 [Parastagonospora nodorum]KAH4344762.1 hypothetical protein HBH98_127970 [Parastagonospora nodorum]